MIKVGEFSKKNENPILRQDYKRNLKEYFLKLSFSNSFSKKLGSIRFEFRTDNVWIECA